MGWMGSMGGDAWDRRLACRAARFAVSTSRSSWVIAKHLSTTFSRSSLSWAAVERREHVPEAPQVERPLHPKPGLQDAVGCIGEVDDALRRPAHTEGLSCSGDEFGLLWHGFRSMAVNRRLSQSTLGVPETR